MIKEIPIPTPKLKKSILNRDEICQKCGNTRRLEVHHITPFVISQDNSPDNLITLCHECHKFAPDNPNRLHKYLLNPLPIKYQHIPIVLKTFYDFIKQNPNVTEEEVDNFIFKWIPIIFNPQYSKCYAYKKCKLKFMDMRENLQMIEKAQKHQ